MNNINRTIAIGPLLIRIESYNYTNNDYYGETIQIKNIDNFDERKVFLEKIPYQFEFDVLNLVSGNQYKATVFAPFFDIIKETNKYYYDVELEFSAGPVISVKSSAAKYLILAFNIFTADVSNIFSDAVTQNSEGINFLDTLRAASQEYKGDDSEDILKIIKVFEKVLDSVNDVTIVELSELEQ